MKNAYLHRAYLIGVGILKKEEKMVKTSLGLEENIEGALCYILVWVSGIVFLIVENENQFVRFHAMQSIVTFIPLMALMWIFGIIPFVGWIISPIIAVLILILWLVLMLKAYQGERYKLPIVGDIAENFIK